MPSKCVVEISTFSIELELLFTPTINMCMCYPLVIPTWYPLLGFTWNFFPGEARCGVFLRNWVTYRDHLPLDIFGGWHLWTSPVLEPLTRSLWNFIADLLINVQTMSENVHLKK